MSAWRVDYLHHLRFRGGEIVGEAYDLDPPATSFRNIEEPVSNGN